MLYNDYALAKQNFASDRQRAMDERTCFCMCGCRSDSVPARRGLTGRMPGLCRKCDTSRSLTHGLATCAANLYIDPMDSTPAPKRNVIARLISPDKRGEATEYAKAYGTEVGGFMSTMSARVRSGKQLTDAQVDAVLRNRDAERKSAKSALRRALSEQKRHALSVDLVRVVIPKTLKDGRYAVQGDAGDWCILCIERPRKGIYRGFVVVSAVLGEGMTRYGLQYPQPAHTTPGMVAQGYVQSYRGYMPQLVHRLVEDPAKAAKAYENLIGKPE